MVKGEVVQILGVEKKNLRTQWVKRGGIYLKFLVK